MHDYLAAWSRGDGDAVTAFMTDDVVYVDTTLQQRWDGKAQVAEEVARAHSLGLTFVAERCFDAPDHFCIEWTMQPSGISAVSVGRLHRGKIASSHDYWNKPADPSGDLT